MYCGALSAGSTFWILPGLWVAVCDPGLGLGPGIHRRLMPSAWQPTSFLAASPPRHPTPAGSGSLFVYIGRKTLCHDEVRTKSPLILVGIVNGTSVSYYSYLGFIILFFFSSLCLSLAPLLLRGAGELLSIVNNHRAKSSKFDQNVNLLRALLLTTC